MVFVPKVLALVLPIAYIVLDIKISRAERVTAASVGHHATEQAAGRATSLRQGHGDGLHHAFNLFSLKVLRERLLPREATGSSALAAS